MLTRQERLLLSHLAERQRAGEGCTFRGMMPYAGTTSTSAIAGILDSLEERGYLRRMRNRASAIEILKEPEEGYLTVVPAGRGVVVDAPVLTGLRQDARTWETDEGRVVVERAWIPLMTSCRPHFAWRARDASMIGVGVVEGDLCVMMDLETGTWRHRTMSGSIVLAQVGRGPLLLRRIMYGPGGACTLESNCPDPAPIRTTKRRTRIVGCLVSSMRVYG